LKKILHEPDALQNGKGLLFEFSFGQLNTTKGQKQLLPLESHDTGRPEVRRPKTWTIKDRLALAQVCRQKLLAFPELSRRTLSKQLGFTVARLNQIMELLKLAPEIIEHLQELSAPAIARLTEENLRSVAVLKNSKLQWMRLRELD